VNAQTSASARSGELENRFRERFRRCQVLSGSRDPQTPQLGRDLLDNELGECRDQRVWHASATSAYQRAELLAEFELHALHITRVLGAAVDVILDRSPLGAPPSGVALVEWVERGIAPPDSRFPSRAAGTLVPLAEARATFPRPSQVDFPNVLNELRLRDHSVEPPIESTAYPVFVQSTDADGNALGGIRHPLLTAPLATPAGWDAPPGLTEFGSTK
jgi:hypothetical protein